jgi:outer membrane protein assembly factor BamB
MRWIIVALCLLSVIPGTMMAGDQQDEASIPLAPSQNAVFVVQGNTGVKKLGTDTGLQGWTATGFVYPQTPAISEDGLVVVCTRDYVEAYNTKSGIRRWRKKLKDTDPTSPTIHGKVVSVSTESCTIYAMDVSNGRWRWSRYLSSHLQTQVSAWENTYITTSPSVTKDGKTIDHALVGVVGGGISWATSLSSEALSAPVVCDGWVYTSCTDGTLYCHSAKDGSFCWKRDYKVACAPWIDGDVLYVTVPVTDEFSEPCEAVLSLKCEDGTKDRTVMKRPAAHMKDFDKKRSGLGSAHPGSSALWSYQGSRPCVVGDCLYSSLGKEVACFNVKEKKSQWATSYDETLKKTDPMSTTVAPAETEAKREQQVEQAEAVAAASLDSKTLPHLTSPAVTNGHIYAGTKQGDLYCLDAKTGKVLFSLKFPFPILRQPAVRGGYLCTVSPSGRLYCLKLDREYRKDSWYQWGGASSGNGTEYLSEEK